MFAPDDGACIGPIISRRHGGAIGTGDVFSKGRRFGAWLGLVPKQISTGDRTILGKISRRGNRYLRVLFVQAAWLCWSDQELERYGLKSWIEAAKRRLHPQRARDRARQQACPHRPGRVLAKGRAFELTRTTMQASSDPLDPHAVLGAVKAQPGTPEPAQAKRDGRP